MSDEAEIDQASIQKGIKSLSPKEFDKYERAVRRGVPMGQALDEVQGGPNARVMAAFKKTLNDQFEAFKAQQAKG